MELVDFAGIGSAFPVNSNPLPKYLRYDGGILKPRSSKVKIYFIGRSEGQPFGSCHFDGTVVLWQYKIKVGLFRKHTLNIRKCPGNSTLYAEVS